MAAKIVRIVLSVLLKIQSVHPVVVGRHVMLVAYSIKMWCEG
jgi:hypothetical protein